MVNSDVNLEGLQALARDLAHRLNPGDAVLLHGPLGAGKTAFARSVIEILAGPEADAASPSFPLCLTYDTPRGTIWHYDLYRLMPPADLDSLGWAEARLDGITLVEWPERVRDIQGPGWNVTLSFTGDDETRHVAIEALP